MLRIDIVGAVRRLWRGGRGVALAALALAAALAFGLALDIGSASAASQAAVEATPALPRASGGVKDWDLFTAIFIPFVLLIATAALFGWARSRHETDGDDTSRD